MRDLYTTDVMIYLTAVLLAIGMAVALTALPAHPADLFPGAGPRELMQALQTYRLL
ncbi:MAG TPA: hypothetical protein VKF40_16800 [Burkholderiales bacterium]|nr:hypothetical protein [Burkholderiales bacterium]